MKRFGEKGRGERRRRSRKKLLQREEMMRFFGQQGGLVYEKHRRKIDRSPGYMRDGNVSHFVSVGFSQKTRDRDRYGPAVLRTRRDERAAQSARQQLKERGEGRRRA